MFYSVPPRAGTRTVPFAAGLARHGKRTALLAPDGTTLTYAALAARVGSLARQLGDARRLVAVEAGNDVGSIVSYLACLAAGHPVLLTAPGGGPAVAAYDPDVTLRGAGAECLLDEHRAGSRHELHPDLALLMSTSGSTGSPKLVRLSHDNLQSNAESIANYLEIDERDRAATTLPMHYCYGLSVINSHLLRGAGLIVTDLSVVDRCFWERFREQRGTSFAGVPYTFELLDRVGFAEIDLPDLRYVTQAGGKLAPNKVREYAQLGRKHGWDLFVMYGQTEATARMAYLPPELAAERSEAIGVPIPGGDFTIEPVEGADPGDGELVYRGPNVMLGYAESPADLATGRAVHELRTGDVARRGGDGLIEITGRLSRFVKIFGLRVDLDRAESVFAANGVEEAICAGTDEQVAVISESPLNVAAVRAIAARELGLPATAVRPCTIDEIPRLPSGKPDYRTALALAEATRVPADEAVAACPRTDEAGAPALIALFSEVLGRDDVTEQSTFVGLGGDSLSYVEMSVAIEEQLGQLPADWHVTPIAQLAVTAPPARRRRGHEIETGVLLRAIGMILIVGTHVQLFGLPGSAHILVAAAGFNFARFLLGPGERRERIKSQARSVARLVVPSMIWIAGVMAVTDFYSPMNVFFANAIIGPEQWTAQWHYWFIELLLYTMVCVSAVMAIAPIDRLERRRPFEFALVLLAGALVTRFGLVETGLTNTMPVFWLFMLGWAAARADRTWQRLLLTAVVAAAVPNFFDDAAREATIAIGLLMLVWIDGVRVPHVVSRAAAVIASASLYIYLTHWHVYRHFDDKLTGVVASLAVGVLYWTAASRVMAAAERYLTRLADGSARRWRERWQGELRPARARA